MNSNSTIELPRIEGESSRAYEARTRYVTMGPGRDLRTLAQELDKSLTLVGRWSSQYGWVESARQYDEQVNYIAIQEAAEQYRADLAAHRERTMNASKNLILLASQLSKAMNDALKQPRTIKGADGNTYKLHGIEITTSTLGTLSKAFTTALDLEAHALGIDQLLPTLSADDSE